MVQFINSTICLLLMTILLAGCGGGGGSNDINSGKGGTVSSYVVSGTVTNSAVSTLSGVTVTLTGASTITTTTGSSGTYTFAGAANGNYTLSAALNGYTFSPTSVPIVVNNGNVTGQNLVGTATSQITYNISGTVTNSAGSTLSNVTVTLTGASTITTTTGSSGTYTFAGAANGNYTLSAALNGYTFSPTSIPVVVSNGNVTGQNLVGTATSQITYNISGTVTNSAGSTLSGVTVTLTGASTITTTTGSSGTYTFAGAANGNYTLSAALNGYTFSPTSIPVVVNNGNVTGQNLVGTATSQNTYNISGTVTAGFGGATLTLTGANTTVSTIEWTGNYTFTGVSNGSYTLSVSMSGYTFSPTSIPVVVNNGNVTGQDFVGTANIVSGTVLSSGGQGLSGGASMTLTGVGPANTHITTTNNQGVFTFSGIPNGNYTLSIYLVGCTFSPSSIAVIVANNGNVTGLNFVLTSYIPTYSISGIVASPSRIALPGSSVTIVTYSGGVIGYTTATTDSNGMYTLTGVKSGSYRLDVNSVPSYTFNSQYITVTGKLTGVNFIGL